MKCKVFVAFLSFVFLCSGFAGETFFCNAYAQDKKIVSKKQTSQKITKKWRAVTLGEHGQFKGADGFQMALNMSQDMDEIRIEKGTIEALGLVIPKNKEWAYGIKISGGWNETFTEKSNNPEDTAIVGNKDEYQNNNRILTISNSKGNVLVENIIFSNNYGKALSGQNIIISSCVFANNSNGAVSCGNSNFYNCTFKNNSVTGLLMRGGAVTGNGTFSNCIFTNNSASYEGGVFEGNGTFFNCIFKDNSAGENGGAIIGLGSFYNCTFINNSASNSGGAVDGSGTFSNCTFINNSSDSGGAVAGSGTFSNCIFKDNSAVYTGGAIRSGVMCSHCTIESSIFINNSANSGGAIYGYGSINNCTFINNISIEDGGAVKVDNWYSMFFANSTFFGNKANGNGGAIFAKGEVINCIFYKNIASEQDNDITVDRSFKIDYSLFNNLTGVADIGPNNIMGDPKFIDPDNGNFALASDSPCINKGKVLSSNKNAGKSQSKSKTSIGKKRINIGADLDFKMIKDLLTPKSEQKVDSLN